MKMMVTTLMTASALLAACSTTAQGDPVARGCRSSSAAKLVGLSAPADAQIQKRTGAELIRRIAPGDSVTHDYRENRITIAIDALGKVVQASCG